MTENELVPLLRLDRESPGGDAHLLTIKCFRPYEANVKSKFKKYDKDAKDEMLVRITVSDVDDNAPRFDVDGSGENNNNGVRAAAPVLTAVARVKAEDPDEGDRGKVQYQLANVPFTR